MKHLTLLIAQFFLIVAYGQEVAVLKYSGGGDWYANPTALPNLIKFCNAIIGTTIDGNSKTVEVGSSEIFQYTWVHSTGHGYVFFSEM
jgi:hypothetical protein